MTQSRHGFGRGRCRDYHAVPSTAQNGHRRYYEGEVKKEKWVFVHFRESACQQVGRDLCFAHLDAEHHLWDHRQCGGTIGAIVSVVFLVSDI